MLNQTHKFHLWLIWTTCFLSVLGLASSIKAQASFATGSGGLPEWVKNVGSRTTPKRSKVFPVNAPGDGATNSTKAIQKAIDVCSKAGGGIVTFKRGSYVTGALFLKRNVHLRIDKGVTLLGSQQDSDYSSSLTRGASL